MLKLTESQAARLLHRVPDRYHSVSMRIVGANEQAIDELSFSIVFSLLQTPDFTLPINELFGYDLGLDLRLQLQTLCNSSVITYNNNMVTFISFKQPAIAPASTFYMSSQPMENVGFEQKNINPDIESAFAAITGSDLSFLNTVDQQNQVNTDQQESTMSIVPQQELINLGQQLFSLSKASSPEDRLNQVLSILAEFDQVEAKTAKTTYHSYIQNLADKHQAVLEKIGKQDQAQLEQAINLYTSAKEKLAKNLSDNLMLNVHKHMGTKLLTLANPNRLTEETQPENEFGQTTKRQRTATGTPLSNAIRTVLIPPPPTIPPQGETNTLSLEEQTNLYQKPTG